MRQTIRQDFAASVRPILFDTGIDEFQYATHGGSAFAVGYKGRPYAITCRHVFKDFDEGQLTIFGAAFPVKGDKPARIKTFCYPTTTSVIIHLSLSAPTRVAMTRQGCRSIAPNAF